MKDYLSILGFDCNLETFPRMKEVRVQFLKLALLKHPDKNTNKAKADKDMKELLKAYKMVGKYIEEKKQEDKDDNEESEARIMENQ